MCTQKCECMSYGYDYIYLPSSKETPLAEGQALQRSIGQHGMSSFGGTIPLCPSGFLGYGLSRNWGSSFIQRV